MAAEFQQSRNMFIVIQFVKTVSKLIWW